MLASTININSTPLGPYVGILKKLSQRDRQIVIEYLQQIPNLENVEVETASENMEISNKAVNNME